MGTPREVGYPQSILRARTNLQLTLTTRQREILVGSILGDGYIHPQGKFQLEQGDAQEEYLFWKYYELKELAYPARPVMVERYDPRTEKTYRSYRFWLRQYFRPWREVFYEGKMKIFPEGLILSPLSIAVWYMDDGCLSDGVCTISIESFSEVSIERIRRQLLNQFQLETLLRSNGKLLICAQMHERFFLLIKPFMHPSMFYKIS